MTILNELRLLWQHESTITIKLFVPFSLVACQQPLDQIYSPTSYPQDLENIRSQGQAEADQTEQVEFNDYEGVGIVRF